MQKGENHRAHRYSICPLLTNLSTGNEGPGFRILRGNRHRGMKNNDLANQFYKEREADFLGLKRVRRLSSDIISIAIQIVKDAIKTGFELTNT